MRISKFMKSKNGQQVTTIHILTNISRSKDNQAMKFGQSLKYNIRNIFLEKWYTKCGEETSPKPFSNKSTLNISLVQQFKDLCSLFLLNVQVEGYRNIYKVRSKPLLSSHINLFYKKVWNYFIASFSKFHLSDWFYFWRCFPGCDVINFEINPSFLVMPFSQMSFVWILLVFVVRCVPNFVDTPPGLDYYYY